MIQSFGNKETENFWKGLSSKKLPNEIQHIGRRKLRMINNAFLIRDLKIPLANKLKKLKGDRSGICSIRVNDQWRITFVWQQGNAINVKIGDCHG